MNNREDLTTASTKATAFEAPALLPIGDAKNVVLGLPWLGDEHFGCTPPRFEFHEDDVEGDGPSKPYPGDDARHDTGSRHTANGRCERS